jgi:hypothetical protein
MSLYWGLSPGLPPKKSGVMAPFAHILHVTSTSRILSESLATHIMRRSSLMRAGGGSYLFPLGLRLRRMK